MKVTQKRILCACLVIAMLCGITTMFAPSASALTYNGSSSFKSGKYYTQLANVQLTGDQRTDIVNVATTTGFSKKSASVSFEGDFTLNYYFSSFWR